jgi:hypothetical protein
MKKKGGEIHSSFFLYETFMRVFQFEEEEAAARLTILSLPHIVYCKGADTPILFL